MILKKEFFGHLGVSYLIDTDGQVSIKGNYPLKGSPYTISKDNKGYWCIKIKLLEDNFKKRNKTLRIHSLMCKLFYHSENEKIIFIDGDINNYKLDNLYVVKKPSITTINELKKQNIPYKDIANFYKMSYETLYRYIKVEEQKMFKLIENKFKELENKINELESKINSLDYKEDFTESPIVTQESPIVTPAPVMDIPQPAPEVVPTMPTVTPVTPVEDVMLDVYTTVSANESGSISFEELVTPVIPVDEVSPVEVSPTSVPNIEDYIESILIDPQINDIMVKISTANNQTFETFKETIRSELRSDTNIFNVEKSDYIDMILPQLKNVLDQIPAVTQEATVEAPTSNADIDILADFEGIA